MRSETIKLRVTPEEKRRMVEAASAENRTLSDWARLKLVSSPIPRKGRAATAAA